MSPSRRRTDEQPSHAGHEHAAGREQVRDGDRGRARGAPAQQPAASLGRDRDVEREGDDARARARSAPGSDLAVRRGSRAGARDGPASARGVTMLAGRTVVLGVSGGIAAYKAAEIVRWLKKEGAAVVVVMTKAAKEFISPLTLATLSGNPVLDDLW